MKLFCMDFKNAAAKIEQDFGVAREYIPARRVPVKSAEQIVNEKINQAFDFCFAGRQALRAELKRRGDGVPSRMILDLGRLEIISSELIGDPGRVASGLRLLGRWF